MAGLYSTPSVPRERLLLSASRIAKALVDSPSSMRKAETRTAFASMADPDSVWAFALMLAGWHLQSRSGEVVELLMPYRLDALYQQFRSIPLLDQAVAKAVAAQDAVDLAGASGVFAAAFENVSLTLLQLGMGMPAYQQARRVLLSAFPLSAAEALVRGTASMSGPTSSSAGMASRAHRLDRTDSRFRYTAPSSRAQVDLLADVMPSGTTPMPDAAMPSRDPRTVALEYLGDLGYTADEIDQIEQRRARQKGRMG